VSLPRKEIVSIRMKDNIVNTNVNTTNRFFTYGTFTKSLIKQVNGGGRRRDNSRSDERDEW
jgi:hypothetical protein